MVVVWLVGSLTGCLCERRGGANPDGGERERKKRGVRDIPQTFGKPPFLTMVWHRGDSELPPPPAARKRGGGGRSRFSLDTSGGENGERQKREKEGGKR